MKILLVEDEKLIREHFAQSIPWSEYGLQLCGAAANGEEGFEIYCRERPEIVLTDIRMPKMDGLDLCSRILDEKNEGTIVILLTAYDDFKLAQQALRIGAYDYVLKTAPTEELIRSVLKAKEEISSKKSKLRGIERERDMLSGNYDPSKSPADTMISNIKRYILDNCGLDLSLNAVAKAVGLNPSYLSSFFKKETGVGFSEYIAGIRMKKAHELLCNTDVRIRDIARLVGYQDEKYFALVFKQTYGVTPSKYRLLSKTENEN